MDRADNPLSIPDEYFAQREILQTGDGSKTLYLPQLKEQYHSRYGAIAESEHIYIRHGLLDRTLTDVSVFEVGFGTGLNAMLSFLAARKNGLTLRYSSVELYPLTESEYDQLGHIALLDPAEKIFLKKILQSPWNTEISIDPCFSLLKIQHDILRYKPESRYDVVYFDAFAPSIQPALWSDIVFRKIFAAMNEGGILSTYSSNIKVQRALREVGFSISKLPGPPGKREILQAIKK